eukprot:1445920-Rhodomonas_salina.1
MSCEVGSGTEVGLVNHVTSGQGSMMVSGAGLRVSGNTNLITSSMCASTHPVKRRAVISDP